MGGGGWGGEGDWWRGEVLGRRFVAPIQKLFTSYRKALLITAVIRVKEVMKTRRTPMNRRDINNHSQDKRELLVGLVRRKTFR